MISQRYSELRLEDNTQTLPITARCLETMIRLSSAHAKLRVSSKIEVQDVEAVFSVLQFALTNDANPVDDSSISSKPMDMQDGAEEDGEGMDVEGEEKDEPLAKRSSNAKRKKPMDHSTPSRLKAARAVSGTHASRALSLANAQVDPAKKQQVTKQIARYWRKTRSSSVDSKVFIAEMKKGTTYTTYTAAEINEIIADLHKEGKIFLTEGKMYQV